MNKYISVAFSNKAVLSEFIARAAYNALVYEPFDEDEGVTAWDVADREGYSDRTKDLCLVAAKGVVKALDEAGLKIG